MKKVLVTGGTGFIGLHLIRRLKQDGHWVRCVDIAKPRYATDESDEFLRLDLRNERNSMIAVMGMEWVFNLAAHMGGAGFVFTGDHDIDIMRNNTLINVNMLDAAHICSVEKYAFSSSACVYRRGLQTKEDHSALKESDAYPADPDSCLTPDTEVMTRNGFKFISDITMDDEIATISGAGYLEYHRPIQRQIMEYDGKLIHFHAKYYDCLVTPQHKVYASSKREEKPVRVDAQDFISRKPICKGFFKRNCKWLGRQDYPKNVVIPSVPFEVNPGKAYRGKRRKAGYTFRLDDYLRFLGWYITEGCCILHAGKGYEIHIRQTHEGNLQSIQRLINRMGITFYSPKDGRVVIDSKSLWIHLKEFGQGAANKKLPLWVLDLPPNKLRILFDVMMLGDGHDAGNRRTYCTSSPFLRDQVVEICLKLGHACTIATIPQNGNIKERYIVGISMEYHIHQVTDDNIDLIDYAGHVYDLTVPNHVFYIRRNGKHIWTGNSYGWEKIYTERMCDAYRRGSKMQIRIARFHNIFGEEGQWRGGREKLPAAAARKVAIAKFSGNHVVDVWGDGQQTRSFCHVNDLVEGLMRLMKSDYSGEVNLGTDNPVAADAIYNMLAEIAGIEIELNHIPGPVGVYHRNADLTLMRKVLDFEPQISLLDGLKRMYQWVEGQVLQNWEELNV